MSHLFPREALTGLTTVLPGLGLTGALQSRELPVLGPEVGQLVGEDPQLGGGLVQVILH